SFFRRAAGWLRPGGRVAISAWLAAGPHGPGDVRLLHQVCEGFLCPSLGTSQEYLTWMEDAGLTPCVVGDLSDNVAGTWEICDRRVRRFRIPSLARWAGPKMSRFIDHFETMIQAYRTGALRYICFVAQKPS